MTIKDNIKTNRIMILIILVILLFIISVLLIILYQFFPGILPIFYSNNNYSNTSIVYMNQDDVDILNSRYKSDVKEFIYCLYGEAEDDAIIVERIKETTVIEAENDYIKYKSCSKYSNYLGTLHSHPAGTCKMSTQDYYTFGRDNAPLAGVICGVDKYAIYGTDNLEKKYNLEVI